MAESPFAFFRGAAAVMAMDLSTTPVTGLTVQACGDAHVANFGTFATPERNVVFDINDFDETDPGPWEWDVKRLAASLHVVAREHGFRASRARRASCSTAVRVYREYVDQYAGMRTLDVWYDRTTADDLVAHFPKRYRAQARARRHPGAAQGPPPRGRPAHRPTPTAGRASSRTRRSSCTSTTLGADMDDVDGDGRRLPRVAHRRAALPASTASAWSTSPAGSSASAASAPGAGSCLFEATGDAGDGRPDRAPGEGGAAVGARAVRGADRARARGPAGGGGPAAHPGGQRPLPRAGARAAERAPLLRAPALGREGSGRPHPDGSGQADPLRRPLRPGAGPGPRPHRRRRRHRRLPRAAAARSTDAIAGFAANYAATNVRDHAALVDAIASGRVARREVRRRSCCGGSSPM